MVETIEKIIENNKTSAETQVCLPFFLLIFPPLIFLLSYPGLFPFISLFRLSLPPSLPPSVGVPSIRGDEERVRDAEGTTDLPEEVAGAAQVAAHHQTRGLRPASFCHPPTLQRPSCQVSFMYLFVFIFSLFVCLFSLLVVYFCFIS